MSEERRELPFKTLGQRLKTIRQKLQESVAEVSGAVEIDQQMLERIEQGSERPSEDILLLLISHFGMHEDEAAGLWQLAGYDQPHSHADASQDDTSNNRTMVMIMAVDPRIVYSDGVQVTANQNGVVMQFSQATNTPHMLTTARVGMSREQAQQVVHVLQEALQRSTPRQLPGSIDQKADKADKKEDRAK